MNITAPEDRRDLKSKMRNWLVGWLGPEIPEFRDLNLSCETKAMTRLRTTLSGIDDIFLAAFKRSLVHKKMPGGDWKANLTISPKDEEDFGKSIVAAKFPSQVSNLSFFQDQDKIRFWSLAINFLILENDGFPGRRVFEDGKWIPFPTPNIFPSGFSSHLLVAEKVASHLPHQVITAITSVSHLSEREDILGHIRKRIDLLDSLLESTFRPRSISQQLVSLAAEIDRSWPKKVPRVENFLPSGRIVQAYPQGKGRSIPTPTITMIISISSVVSAGLAVLSYLKATQQAGTTQDADFFSLAQNSVMQIASILIIMLSLPKTQFRDHARIYTWFLVIFGVISALVAIPVYILIPTGWSTLLSAASGISQSLVTLQLVYSLAA